MQMTIFLGLDEARFLREVMPSTCPASGAIARAMHVREYWGEKDPEVAVECDDSAGLDLLDYAQSYCPTASEKIRQALRLSHLHRW